MTTASSKTNRLASETSPYLLQHASNPVDWYAWGEEAFAASRQANKPILLSIGYAACHWCHVMAHESFEDPETADLMNRYFINIKVDREERPDVDKIYMDALHHMGEQGGWPLTMFLDTELKPFWGGTYFPPTNKYGRPSFSHVLTQIHHIWTNEHDKIRTNTTAILQRLSAPAGGTTDTQVHPGLLETAISQILSAMDWQHGGIGMAPKFPQSPLFQLLWTMARTTGHTKAREAVTATMTHICQGGIYDHLGGGIARYAVDQRWLVPHFEKMLYDNAQFVSQLGDILATAENQLFRQRIEETCQWLIDEMTTPDGLFAASYDADSEGEEGKYYCWSKAEVDQIVSESSRYLFQSTYDVTEAGNWEHQNILNRLNSMNLLSDDEEAQLKTARQQLLEARKDRIPPGWDDKALTDWNALTVQALLKASVILDRPDLQSRAVSTLNALQECLTSNGALHHSYRRKSLRGHATADDYAHLIAASIETYEHTLDPAWIEQAQDHAQVMISDYLADDGTGFHMSPAAATDLIVRQVYRTDDVTPNANATMAINLWKLSVLSSRPEYHHLANKIIAASTRQMTNNPFACPSAWTAWIALSRQSLIVLCGDNNHGAYKELHRTALRHRDPITLVMHAEPGTFPEEHPAHRKGGEPEPTAYFCKNQACSLPITDAPELKEAL